MLRNMERFLRKVGGVNLSKIIKRTRTRLIVKGKVDIAKVVSELKDWGAEKRIYISGRYNKRANVTFFYVKPFERIHTVDRIIYNGKPLKNPTHKIIIHGNIPNADGTPMNYSQLSEQVCLPAKKHVDKSVTYFVRPEVHEETGAATWAIEFWASNTEDFSNLSPEERDAATAKLEKKMEANITKCKDYLSLSLMNIIDSKAADNESYIKNLEIIMNALVKIVRKYPG